MDKFVDNDPAKRFLILLCHVSEKRPSFVDSCCVEPTPDFSLVMSRLQALYARPFLPASGRFSGRMQGGRAAMVVSCTPG